MVEGPLEISKSNKALVIQAWKGREVRLVEQKYLGQHLPSEQTHIRESFGALPTSIPFEQVSAYLRGLPRLDDILVRYVCSTAGS